MIDLNQLRDQAYKCACDHGFHDTELSNEHFLMLVITELSEAVEADRKGKRFDKEAHKLGEYAECQGWLTREEQFRNVFERYVKYSVDDELADAAILLLDIAGLRGIDIESFTEEDIDDMSESCNDETFTESVYAISTMPIRYEYEYGYTIGKQINATLLAIFGFAKHLDIDLLWHIQQNMRYNQLRAMKHGKKY